LAYYCSNPWTTVFIWGNGDVTHCCYSNFGPLGNINRQSLDQIWHGEKLNYIRLKVARAEYIQAGCEHFCRAFRWNKYYGQQDEIPEISEGLGRISEFSLVETPPVPAIIGVELGEKCNLHCTHCLASRDTKGLSADTFKSLRPFLEQARIVRIIGGEFTVNPASLEALAEIGAWERQPVVFMNTNGQISMDNYFHQVQNLRSFHLKFSLEGLGADYNLVRVGGSWERFLGNLLPARDIFARQNEAGKDWRLYLNFCVMRSNFSQIPKIVEFAVANELRLVVNPINGMRHTNENFFMYDHLMFFEGEINQVVSESHQIMDRGQYFFASELKQHLDYIVRALQDRKLHLSPRVLNWIQGRFQGQKADRLLYIIYKWKLDRLSCFIYVYRKIKKRWQRYWKHE
jgi:MoaA/NifB/PqqE/SkfB family radical SAM enzyme